MVTDNYSLRLCDLSIGYIGKNGGKCLAKELNGGLTRGALTCLTGLNGSGKSTLLRTMDGYQKPLHGSVLLNGKPVATYPLKEIAKHIGIVLTEKIPSEALTVFDIVAMGRLPYTGFFGRLNASDKAIVTDALEKVQMAAFSQRRFYELSDGERQKVLIAKAIAQQTEIVLLDEPLSFLDYPSKIAVLQLLRKMAHRDNISILLSIHDQDLTQKTADYIWELKDGKLSQTKNEAQSGFRI